MNVVFYLALVLFLGFVMGKLVSLIKLPNVTGYLLAGLLAGPYALKLVPQNAVSSMGIISDVALGMIAFNIGSEFSLSHLKKLGWRIITVTMLQSMGAFAAVLAALTLLLNQSFSFSMVIAAIATATAPAATLLVIKQYKAKGPVTDVLLPVVALDDAVCIIAFSISAAIAKSMINPAADTSLLMTIMTPLKEIIIVIIIGIGGGLLVTLFKTRVKNKDELLVVTLGTILVTAALAQMWNVSNLIACMMIGATIVNLTHSSHSVFSSLDRITLPIYVAFFTLSGADLNIGILKSIGIVGICYILARSIGKIAGAYLGAKFMKMPETVQKYLGITLLPQAGVAIGLSIAAQSILPEYSSTIRTIVLSATLIYEIFGPVLTKIALIQAGEIGTPDIHNKKTSYQKTA
ncbi:MAG TPA: cation:proton antiporter [Clostridiales bacterium]|nr:cation:proton antiporter [Clostridiales bacterium]